MPPIRSITSRPIKTERTHEENQERAYIAASRRSDRSLEARVESARRASEIHKRRTGRSLRVTEQDVINEEMYEEEDDDLPLQYRRLTAHLNTNSPDFNRRLAAYLTTNVAMRNALDQAISTSYAQQQPTPQMWGQQFQQFQPLQQPWIPEQMHGVPMMQQVPYQTPMMVQPQMMQHDSAQNFRQQPYPAPQSNPRAYRPNVQRSMSMTNSQNIQTPNSTQPAHQQSPTQPPTFVMAESQTTPQRMPQLPRTTSSVSLPDIGATVHSPVKKSSSVPPMVEHDLEQTQQSAPMSAVMDQAPAQPWPSSQHDIGPLSATISPETQMFFQANYNTPSMYLPNHSSEKVQQPFYSYNPNSIKQRGVHPSYDGMNQTLAPGALDNLTDTFSWPTPTSATTESVTTPYTPVVNMGFDSMNPCDGLLQKSSPVDHSAFMQPGSGYVTPGEAEWSSFIDPNSWSDVTV